MSDPKRPIPENEPLTPVHPVAQNEDVDLVRVPGGAQPGTSAIEDRPEPGAAAPAPEHVDAPSRHARGTPIIELRDVDVTFTTRTGSLFSPSKVHAMRDVSLRIMPGTTVGIVGESGSGKSTTANVMCGLQEATAGSVHFTGEEVTKRSAAMRRRIGRVVSVVFQDPATALNPRMVVRDQLTDPLKVHDVGTPKERAARVRELMGLVGLPSSALDALPAQLSGGQRQRVAIARALTLNPDAIIADEPTSALDVSVRAQILNLLTDLKRDLGLAMVFISHDIQTVRYVSDEIAVMNHGRIIEHGTAREVLEKPSTDYTRTLLGAAPSLLRPNTSTSRRNEQLS